MGIVVRAGTTCFILCWSLSAAAQLTETQLTHRSNGEGWVKRFKGSQVQLDTQLGSGTFVLDAFGNNPLLSQSLSFLPRFRITEQQSVRLYWSMDCEYTAPDNSSGRRCSGSDTRISYHHNRLWQDPWIAGQVMGSFQVWAPTSLESQLAGTVVNLRTSVSYLVQLLNKRLQLYYGFSAQKYLPTRKVRGGPDEPASGADSLTSCLVRSGAAEDAACGAGGPLNSNWMLRNSVNATWFFSSRLWLSVGLMVLNQFRFSVADDALDDDERLSTGRADFTMGAISLAYQWRDHVVLSAGASSFQPALTADSKFLRFPWWDFTSPSNNYSKLSLSATVVY